MTNVKLKNIFSDKYINKNIFSTVFTYHYRIFFESQLNFFFPSNIFNHEFFFQQLKSLPMLLIIIIRLYQFSD